MIQQFYVLLYTFNSLNSTDNSGNITSTSYHRTPYFKYKTCEPLLEYCDVYTKQYNGSNHLAQCASRCNEKPACMYFGSTERVSCFMCLLQQSTHLTTTKHDTVMKSDTIVYGKACKDNGGSFAINCGLQCTGDYGSYLLYTPDYMPALVLKYTIKLQFKTTLPNGILLFTTKRDDFVGCYIKGGYLKHSINNGGGNETLTSTRQFNDGQWHEVVFTKDGRNMSLTIEDEYLSGATPGWKKGVNTDDYYFVGGIPLGLSSQATQNLGISQGFAGCLKVLNVNGNNIGPPKEILNVQYCN